MNRCRSGWTGKVVADRAGAGGGHREEGPGRRAGRAVARWSSARTATCKYETVVKVMDTLQRAGVKRLGLAVQVAK
jgi:hypothetical protein